MAKVDSSFLAKDTFASVKGIHPMTLKAMSEKFNYSTMSRVQSLTIPVALTGADVVAKAQTGTGKTIAFLVPVVQKAAARGIPGISGLVLAPTRELAIQIHTECAAMTAFHKLTGCVMVGGTSLGKDQKAFAGRLDILIATPGRLLDHLKNTTGASAKVSHIDTLTLDEADRMLDMGFRPDLERIMSFLPKSRQTLLFSATIAKEVIELAPRLFSPTFMFVDAGTGKTMLTSAEKGHSGAAQLVADDPFVTAKQVTQFVSTVPQEKLTFEVANTILRERQVKGHKIIVFFTTARQTQLFAELFAAMGCPVLEIHSRKSQKHRLTTSDTFRDSKNVVMFSSDVTARGLDYPDVTMVLQVGLPASAEQYVHRLGRTGRAGNEGRGLLMLMPEEQYFLKQVSMLPIKPAPAAAPQVTEEVVEAAMRRVDQQTRHVAYAAWLGFYNTFCGKLKWSKEYLVQRANQLAVQSLLLSSPPPLQKKTIGKMGLKGVPGLVIEGERRDGADVPARRGPRTEQPPARGPVGSAPQQPRGPIGSAAQPQAAPQGGRGASRGGARGGGDRGFGGARGGRGNGRGGRGGYRGQ